MSSLSTRVLQVLTPLTAALSLVVQSIALCSNTWFHSEELMKNPQYNGSGDSEFLSKFTVSGLWSICYTDPGKLDMRCTYIDYFPKEEYSPDPNDSTMSIPYAMKRAATFIFLSSFTLTAGELLFLLGQFIKKYRVLIFAGGISFVISGLLILMGVVIYISSFKAEVGSKLQSKSSFQGPLLSYRYGYCFILAVTGILLCELSGIFAISLYIHWYKYDYKKENERLKYFDFVLPEDDKLTTRYHPTQDYSQESSFCSSLSRGRVTDNGVSLSISMRDLKCHHFPRLPRDITCNTMSTTADFHVYKECSREVLYDDLPRSTVV
ncbi:voltage-dependent calcium channel gamma-5 subunit-like [Limulus polyphemus]|uniref:Voltage-dependent calcium channel gamma-5 subunit-like n=1 Tax=Limulus polyphemus TaxID=6850 RepID=A0ABM1C0C4_LIMPO|nr:voltage-dependent calcium channel gamma-5 subunit-like [Limulus polyphemus]